MSKPFSFRQEVVQNHIKKIQSQESPNQKSMTPKKKNIPYTFPHSLMNIPTASAYAQIENTPPWLNSKIDPIDPYKCLDIDIYDFVQFISPGDLELQMRKDVVDRVGSLLKASDNESLKNVKLESFGSYANGLYLPTSDIDMIILDPKETFLTANQCGSKLQRFLHKFRKAGYNAVFIYSSKVPILKLVDSKTLIDIDISYSAESATQVLSATKLSISYQKQYPFLKPLVLVLKQFLLLRDLNSNAKCGIGGYALLLLVVSFLKIHPMLYGQQSSPFNISPKRKKSKQNDTQPSIGRILIDFFHYFGTVFDYRNNGLSPGGWNGDDSIVLFSKKEKGFFDVKLPSHLVIIDPLDSKNNLTYNTKLIQSISTSFRDAYETIVQKVNSEVDLSNGLLKFIMNVSKESERKRLEKRIMFSKTRLSKTLDYTPALNTHSVRPMAPYPSNPAYQPYKYNQKGHSRFAPYPPTPQYYSNSGHQRPGMWRPPNRSIVFHPSTGNQKKFTHMKLKNNTYKGNTNSSSVPFIPES